MDEEKKHAKINLIPDYQKVMQHLEKENFALESCLGKKYVSIKIPGKFSISEKPDETIYLFRKVYTIGKMISIQQLQLDYSECE